jgi:integrating conjugative element protein (TIGR03761 family)
MRDTPLQSEQRTMGRLLDETPDAMVLHTRDAWQMFVGRAADPVHERAAIPGGRRFAAMLKAIWHLSANDNPYADWILIRVYRSLGEIRSQMDERIQAREVEFERLRRKGLALSVLGSRAPITVELGFRSPYGYATAEAIVEFDYHVRMVRTLMLKDRLSDEAGRAEIRAVGRGLRALFLEPIRWERNLLREELLPLSRRDFLPEADPAARQRAQAAVALFGEVPREVFTGEEAPRHTQRRIASRTASATQMHGSAPATDEAAQAATPEAELL